ncbi:MAG: hypothetical protein GAK35_01038 [Herbaspirillum frisingense]|uniref:Uncharacterized protein n=1 Tax=Herbaspirillum frisingense TaxID=92645 RepID=A0A7V8FYR8_9BURK|nr:MAG: hypothetical protein GAK35_01038 [Herbaspirillum frisingense]
MKTEDGHTAVAKVDPDWHWVLYTGWDDHKVWVPAKQVGNIWNSAWFGGLSSRAVCAGPAMTMIGGAIPVYTRDGALQGFTLNAETDGGRLRRLVTVPATLLERAAFELQHSERRGDVDLNIVRDLRRAIQDQAPNAPSTAEKF